MLGFQNVAFNVGGKLTQFSCSKLYGRFDRTRYSARNDEMTVLMT